MYENKEEALKELNKIIDEYGIKFNELKENYSSGKTVNTKKKDKVRIRLLSYNEAILKLLVPYGNRQNLVSASVPPWKISEGKYGLKCNITNSEVVPFRESYTKFKILNRVVNIASNLYQFASWGTNCVAMTTTAIYDPNNNFFRTTRDGYGLSYQDNYEDKPEIRVEINSYNYESNYNGYYQRYSRNGEVLNPYVINNGGWSKTFYKTSTAPYAGMWPVINI